MSSNHRTTLTKSELKSNNTNSNLKSYYYNKQQQRTDSPLNTEQTFYAKLVNVNNQPKMERVPVSTTINRNSLQRRNCMRNTAYVTNPSAGRAAMATAAPTAGTNTRDSYLNAKLAEYLNEAEYETLVNFDSVLNKVAIPKVESPCSSAYSTLMSSKSKNEYSNEDEDYQKYYELEKFHSSLKKNIQKASTPPTEILMASGAKLGKSGQFSIVGAKRHDTNSVGSFSSSSASSISSQSSATNSSTTSSSSSSPLLSANFLTENAAAIYSSNFKIRNHNTNNKSEVTGAASPLPALPLTQPPSLTPLKELAFATDSKLIKSQSAIITKTMGSAWIHPSLALNSPTPSSSSSRAPIADMDDSCAYSELTDSNTTIPSACVSTAEAAPSTMTTNSTLKRSGHNNLKQYDSSLLTPLKPKMSTNLTSPVRSNSSTNIKSASTSYLLSKISSLTAANGSTNATNSTSHSNASPQQTTATTNPLTSLANKTSKFFQSRKSLNQLNQYQDTTVDTHQAAETQATPSSNSCHSIATPDLCVQKHPMASLDKIKLASVSSSASSTTSRRGFIKKRSQSTHMPVNKQSWSYNKLLDCWTLLNQCDMASSDSQNANNFIASTLRITKRKSANTQASNRIAQYMNSLADSQADTQKLRLTKIELKYLTQVELKYLKQICFNKLKSELDQLKQQQVPVRKQSLGNYSECLSTIPKDESLKCTKTKNIALRSKSVDFKFFDELKENYFSKKAGVQSATQVFGQSLYKCILNDLQRLPGGNKAEAISASASSGKRSWRSSNQNVLIASKFDLNIQRKNQQLPPKCDAELMLNKRNSVLFEALDLKNMKHFQKHMATGGQLTPVLLSGGAHKARGSRSRHTNNKNRSKSPTSTGEPADSALNQNLSIRPEGLVPNIVKSCCNHISEHGLDLVGIFRIDSSKKRIKEIKEMYDSGKPVAMDEHFNPNDSACILKEYLRSLPEPLLTRDLYASFLATSKIKDATKKLELMSLLVCLLPVPNRDTLQVLLKLLDKVRANASNSESTGNKMDAFNLAMVFGPNLLKKHSGSGQISVRGISSGKLNDMSDKYNLIDDIDAVISVAKYLIENQNDLFHIESQLHNELIETINKINPAEVNSILGRKQMTEMGIDHLPPSTSTISSSSSTSSSEAMTNQNEYLSLTPTPSEPQSLLSSPHSIHLSTNTSCSSASSHSRTAASSSSLSTPEPGTNNNSNSNFLNYLNADFIDAGHKPFTRQKASRTKLHKIVDNFNYLNCADNNNADLVRQQQQQPIHFINSPTHSPVTKGQKKSSVRMLKKQSLESSMKQQQQQQDSLNKSPVPSSLLLMIQQNNNLINNENKNNSQRYGGKKTQSTKSMSNLTQIPASGYYPPLERDEVASYQVESLRRQSGSNLKHQSQFTAGGSVNSKTIHKFYNSSEVTGKKKAYNIIGEQETLV